MRKTLLSSGKTIELTRRGKSNVRVAFSIISVFAVRLIALKFVQVGRFQKVLKAH